MDGLYLPQYHEDCFDSGVIPVENKMHSFCVFDGLGGGREGETASWIAAQKYSELMAKENERPHASYEKIIPDFWKFSDRIATVCRSINHEICSYGDEKKYRTFGSTIAGITIMDDHLYGYHIGDSRIYHFRDRHLIQCTKDHVPNHIFSSMKGLIQYLGINESEFLICPDLFEKSIQDGDKYLICTDGFSNIFSEEEIRKIMMMEEPLESMESIFQGLKLKEEKDNITAILLYF